MSDQWHYDMWSDGTRTLHDKEGSVFIKEESNGEVIYRNVETDRGVFEDVRAGLLGVDTNAFSNALVRRQGRDNGFFTGYAYYPLPLIYASSSERKMAADVLNKKAPPERWVRRRRVEANKLFNIEEEVTS